MSPLLMHLNIDIEIDSGKCRILSFKLTLTLKEYIDIGLRKLLTLSMSVVGNTNLMIYWPCLCAPQDLQKYRVLASSDIFASVLTYCTYQWSKI